MCRFIEIGGSVSDMVMAGMAIAALIAALFAWRLSKRTFRYQIINELFKEYRSKEMGMSIRKLHEYFRKAGAKRKILISNYKKDYRKEVDSIDSIHNHRRAVSSFYQQVSILAAKDRYIKETAYEIWKKGDLEIIEQIIIPIEVVALRELFGNKALEKKTQYPRYIQTMLAFYEKAPKE
jgi:proline dehydrogenase